eukprot:12510-Heterococcus_DN1.PRE.1
MEKCVAVYFSALTMRGPTLSPVSLLCETCAPLHRGNVSERQHRHSVFLSPAGTRLHEIAKTCSVPATEILITATRLTCTQLAAERVHQNATDCKGNTMQVMKITK